jgi:tetratricopeptide (TPR) repeat protein
VSPAGAPEASEAASSAPADEALQPIPDPQQGDPVTIQIAGFNGVIPGTSTVEDVQKVWGAPLEMSQQGETVFHLYRVAPFERVEVAFEQDKVNSIVIRLDQAFPADLVAKQLKLSAIRPVLISDEMGEILGQAFPERGVLFAFQPSDTPGKATMMVTQIILETITAEPFVLRAETVLDTQAELSLQDLDQALKLAPNNARAHWLRCRVLASRAQYPEALASAEEAVRLESDNPRYLITQGQLLGTLQRFEEAIPAVEKAVQYGESRPHVKARALCLLGDLYGSGMNPDYQKAIKYHTDAIQAADPLATSQHPAVRLAAKEVLVDAHLGAAHDIAWGNWSQKDVAVSRWLKRAGVFAEDLVANEGATSEYRLRVATRALAAAVGAQGQLDPTEWAEEVLRVGQELADSVSEAQKAQYQWTTGLSLYDAVQVYQLRNAHDVALKYGEQAADYLERALEMRPDNPADRYMLGRLYFRLGAIHAVGNRDHAAAVSWFEKAIPALEGSSGQATSVELGRLGETFVSMGVSYWEIGQRDRGMSLTEQGVELMEKAVNEGVMEKASLEIPYGNLASMHRQLGRESDSGQFLQKATRTSNNMQR